MLIKNSLYIFLIIISVCVSSFSQKTDDEGAKIKQKQFAVLIEQIRADTQNLKLSENRAIVYAKTASLVWQNDKKLALELFQNAVGELVNAQMQAEAKPKSSYDQNELRTGQQTRPQILRLIAARDAELALDFLYKTRPAKLLKAMAYQSAKTSKISESSGNYVYLAQNEFNLEQNFIRLAADQNPERAVKLLKDSLKKGFSYETVSLLNKLYEKDSEAAAEIASEIVSKLIQSRFFKDNQPVYQNLDIAVSLLGEFSREREPNEKRLKFDEAQMRNLLDSLISFYLDKGVQFNNLNSHSIIPLAAKFAPAKVAQLKNLRGGNHHGVRNFYNDEMNEILSSETPAQQMISKAGKFPANMRGQIYQSAANKFAAAGDFTSAVGVLNDNFEDSALDDAMRNLNWSYSYQLINEGKYAEAENLIDGFPEDSRIGLLVSLANTIYQKNPAENKSKAVTVLAKARALVSERPENSQELSSLMQIIQGFAQIEPTEAFRLYEPLIPQLNELSEASVVLNGFQGGGNIRQGEFLLSYGDSFGFYAADFSVFQTLAKTDFDRTMSLLNTFTRNEIRLSLKIQLAGSILN